MKKKHGVVELFAQTAELSWDVPSGASVAVPETYDEPCVFPPLILQNQKASTTFAALERGLEGEVCLDWATVVRMTYIANIVLLILGSDLASSNVRLKLEFRRRVKEFNYETRSDGIARGVILMLDVNCTAHIMTQIVKKSFNAQKMIGKMHAMSFVGHHVRFYNRIVRAMIKV